ncbi:hypothetical protein [Methanosphaera sp.]
MKELLEADFAQIEHINQIIVNNLQHDSWDCFDTALLLKQFPGFGTYNSSNPKESVITENIVDLRYNSLLVNITTSTSATEYTFSVRNTLWDGTYRITHSKNDSSEEDVTFTKGRVTIVKIDENTIKVRITGTNHNSMRICFHMNQTAKNRSIATSSLAIQNENEYTDQYDKSFKHQGTIVDENGNTWGEGVKITLSACNSAGLSTDDGLPDASATTNSDGVYILDYGVVAQPGEYYCKITATYSNLEVSKIIKVNKIQENRRGIDWGDAAQYKGVWKGVRKTFAIKLIMYNKYNVHDTNLDSKLHGSRVTVTLINTTTNAQESQTCIVNNKGYIYPIINYRRYYEDFSKIRVSMSANSEFDSFNEEHMVTHEYCTVNNFTTLNSRISDEDGPDWIMLSPTTFKPTSDVSSISITRDITLCGISGTNPVTINGIDTYNPFIVDNSEAEEDNRVKFRLIGLTIQNCNPAIKVNEGSALTIDKCVFKGNFNTASQQKGCCIYPKITDYTLKHHALFQAHIQNSVFYNNVGNEISSIGETHIDNNLFKTDKAQYLKQPEPKVVSVEAGEVTYKHNKSHIKILDKEMSSNHSYAKALTYVRKGAKFNGKGPAQLYGDMTLPIYGSPWYNEAYTYAIYYYPYIANPTKIVCSPRKGYERRATGHGSSAKRWIFYDGYNFIRRSKGNGNVFDPWTSTELAVPRNTGLYNETVNEFTDKSYDPRVSQYNTNGKIKDKSFNPDNW